MNRIKVIYKTRDTGMKNGMQVMRGTRGMFTWILGIVQKIPGNVREDSGECSGRFRGIFKKIPGNLNFDLFLEIFLVFHQIFLLNCYKTMEKTITEQFL